MLYIPSWTTRTSWNHNYKLYVEARISRTEQMITYNDQRGLDHREGSSNGHSGSRTEETLRPSHSRRVSSWVPLEGELPPAADQPPFKPQ